MVVMKQLFRRGDVVLRSVNHEFNYRRDGRT
jgi:hypothetical protein